jgi:NAD+ synthase (glutamine-hydrolysing)
MDRLRIALAQLNAVVGDLSGNARKVLSHVKRAEKQGVNILIFPEMIITGYPPEDLLLKPAFIRDNLKTLDKIRKEVKDPRMLVLLGYVDKKKDIHNAAAVIYRGKVVATYYKIYLPNYGVFDEARYFQPGFRPMVVKWGKVSIGISTCEDMWYPGGPAYQAALSEADILANLSSSPYHIGKTELRERIFATRARENVAVVALCNMVGGQDELVFEGSSAVFASTGEVVARARAFEEDFLLADVDMEDVFHQRLHDPRFRQERVKRPDLDLDVVDIPGPPEQGGGKSRKPYKAIKPRIEPMYDSNETVFRALVLGTRDYISKNGFKKVVVGLSGGLDSSLVAAIATESLGRQNVIGVSMPGPFTSRGTRGDAKKVADNLGIKLIEIPIKGIYSAYIKGLASVFKGKRQDVTEENIQARIRGNLLMALSNKYGWLVLTTGNKSELATGYCTLYGDMAGGFAVLKDTPKTLVYEIARFINKRAGKTIIPKSVIERAPTAELRPDQRDQDTLPPYDELDQILKGYIEEDTEMEKLVDQGAKAATVKKVIRMVDSNEYKRRQAPPGVKITSRAFGKDWRLPITNRYHEP